MRLLQLLHLTILATATVVVMGCASQATVPASSGKHLVYRDSGGKPLRQFDYPSEDVCRRVEAAAGKQARCQPESAGAQLQAQATLRYNPPGLLVQGHYLDLAHCRTQTESLATGVQVVNPCSAK